MRRRAAVRPDGNDGRLPAAAPTFAERRPLQRLLRQPSARSALLGECRYVARGLPVAADGERRRRAPALSSARGRRTDPAPDAGLPCRLPRSGGPAGKLKMPVLAATGQSVADRVFGQDGEAEPWTSPKSGRLRCPEEKSTNSSSSMYHVRRSEIMAATRYSWTHERITGCQCTGPPVS